MTTPTSAEVWRKYNTDGVPASGPHQPDKTQIIAWAGSLESEIQTAIDAASAAAASASLLSIYLHRNFR
ncbi:hypothetical protein E4K66_30735 [Bradyrhizobium frederickii]|uniref:Uncharacterized protein n=1 Tax=Bradyrhizobium frederickii TaxID=2560054 RepID=A0A4Y9KTT4_9BRAD|nr:hypothetical protein [Bradyrhizobium frederickii]TFV34545.1 hypothetical protein E4K66_30735 [Bradyrhizobium frederickii]